MAILSEKSVKIGDKDCVKKICSARKGYFASLHVDGKLFDITCYCDTEETAKGLLADMVKMYQDALTNDKPISGWAKEVFLEDKS